MNFFDIFEEPDKVNSEKRTLSLRGTDRRNSLRLTSGRSTEGIDHFRRVHRLTILSSSVSAPWLKSSSSTSCPESRENLSPTEGGESSLVSQRVFFRRPTATFPRQLSVRIVFSYKQRQISVNLIYPSSWHSNSRNWREQQELAFVCPNTSTNKLARVLRLEHA